MTHTQQQFLALLRSGLWGTPPDAELFKGNVDWKSILRIAIDQTVQIIVADGIETLPKELWPPKETILKLMMIRVKTEQMHKLLNTTLNQITEALNERNIPSVILKGQGVAQNYPRPTSRMCGDIDLYVGEDNYDQACNIIANLDTRQRAGTECDHHMHLQVNGVEVEVHRYADFMPGKRMNRSIQDWTTESIGKQSVWNELPIWNNEDTRITLAPRTFDAFFILHHAVRHMITGGVGFRQICDWTMFLHKHHAQIDTIMLREKLEHFRMTSVWQEFGLLATNILGLPAEELPLAPSSMNSSKTEKILRHIFISGNFGHADGNRTDNNKGTYIKRKWRSFRFQSLRLIKLLGLFPKFILSFCIGWLSEASIRLIRLK